MERKLISVATLLLAFVVGVAFAGFSFFGGRIQQPVEIPEIVLDNLPSDVHQTGRQTLEIVFVLDTTGSMGGLLDAAKERIWGIINEVMQKQSSPAVRVGLVAYRDRGDDYVTQIVPITSDLDKVYTRLMELRAGGGGDSPESVRKALAAGVRDAGWAPPSGGLAQVVFLVGDAPPQAYRDEPDVLETAAAAVRKNMIVNTIQCGTNSETEASWRKIAEAGQGKYFAIAQNGGVDRISTPYDERLSQLGRELGNTYLAYGSAELRAERMTAAPAAESAIANTASNSAKADRAFNKALNKEAYADDLLQDLEKGKVELKNVKTENLPEPLQKMSEAERAGEVEKRLGQRNKIRAEILSLSKQRNAYSSAERAKAGKAGGFDSAVQAALNEQLARRGIK